MASAHSSYSTAYNRSSSNSVGSSGGLRTHISNKVLCGSSFAGLRTTHIESMFTCTAWGVRADFDDTGFYLANGRISPCFTTLTDKE